jgi:hypothetical protein
MIQGGTVNALRFLTKNILSVLTTQNTTIDWLNDYLVLPLAEPVKVRSGEQLHVEFNYLAGGSLQSLERNMRTQAIPTAKRLAA